MTTEQTPARERGTPPSPWRLTLILASLTGFGPFATDMYLASVPLLAAAFGTGTGQVQLGLSLFFLGMAFGQLIYGPLIDRFGRRRPLMIGVGVFVLASLLIAVAPNIESFIALRLLQALGGCAGMIVARAVISDLFEPREAARALSLMMMVQGLAPIIAPVIGGYLAVWLGWRSIFVFLAIFGLVCLIAAGLGLPETLPPEKRQRGNALRVLRAYVALSSERAFIVPTVCCAFTFGGMFAFISGSPAVYMEQYGASETLYGWLFAINAFSLMVASQLNRHLLTRMRMQRVMSGALCGGVVIGLVLVLIGAHAPLPLLVALLWLSTATVPLVAANAIALAMGASGAHRGIGSSIIGVLQFVLAGLVSAVISVLHNHTAFPMTGAILGCSLAAALIWFVFHKR